VARTPMMSKHLFDMIIIIIISAQKAQYFILCMIKTVPWASTVLSLWHNVFKLLWKCVWNACYGTYGIA